MCEGKNTVSIAAYSIVNDLPTSAFQATQAEENERIMIYNTDLTKKTELVEKKDTSNKVIKSDSMDQQERGKNTGQEKKKSYAEIIPIDQTTQLMADDTNAISTEQQVKELEHEFLKNIKGDFNHPQKRTYMISLLVPNIQTFQIVKENRRGGVELDFEKIARLFKTKAYGIHTNKHFDRDEIRVQFLTLQDVRNAYEELRQEEELTIDYQWFRGKKECGGYEPSEIPTVQLQVKKPTREQATEYVISLIKTAMKDKWNVNKLNKYIEELDVRNAANYRGQYAGRYDVRITGRTFTFTKDIIAHLHNRMIGDEIIQIKGSGVFELCYHCGDRGHNKKKCARVGIRLDCLTPIMGYLEEEIRTELKPLRILRGNSDDPGMAPKTWIFIEFTNKFDRARALPALNNLLKYCCRAPIFSDDGPPISCDRCGLLQSDCIKNRTTFHEAKDRVCSNMKPSSDHLKNDIGKEFSQIGDRKAKENTQASMRNTYTQGKMKAYVVTQQKNRFDIGEEDEEEVSNNTVVQTSKSPAETHIYSLINKRPARPNNLRPAKNFTVEQPAAKRRKTEQESTSPEKSSPRVHIATNSQDLDQSRGRRTTSPIRKPSGSISLQQISTPRVDIDEQVHEITTANPNTGETSEKKVVKEDEVIIETEPSNRV
jgi:hypothetical protein